MPIFETLSEIENYIVNVTNKEVAEHASKLAIKVMNEVIEDTVYKNPSHMRGGTYENTYGLMDNAVADIYRYGSGIINTGQMIDVGIIPNGDYPSQPGYGEQYGNNNARIVEWLNYRTNGGMYKGFPMKAPNHKMFDLAKARLMEGGRLKSYVQNFLRSKQYVVSKRTYKDE